MLRVSEPRRKIYAWQLCDAWGIPMKLQNANALMPFIAKHSKDGLAQLVRPRKADMSESVSKDRENLLRTTIALVGGEVVGYPRPSPPMTTLVIVWAVHCEVTTLRVPHVWQRTEIAAMEEFCKVNGLLA